MTELLLHINSSIDRRTEDLSTSQWTTYLANSISASSSNKVEMLIDNIDFPNSTYTFPPTAGTVWWIHDVGNANTLRSLSIDVQRVYDTGADVATALNAAMQSAGYNLSFQFSTLTYKLTLQNKESVPIRLVGSYRYEDLIDQTYNNSCDRLGFTQNTRDTSLVALATMQGAGVLRTLRSSCYYLTADILSNRIRQSQFPNEYQQPSVIGRIGASNFGSLSQLQTASSVFFNSQGTTSIDRITFGVLDDELNPVEDLGGMPICFSLRIIIS